MEMGPKGVPSVMSSTSPLSPKHLVLGLVPRTKANYTNRRRRLHAGISKSLPDGNFMGKEGRSGLEGSLSMEEDTWQMALTA